MFLDIYFVFDFVGVDLGEAWSLKCRGRVYGIIGKIQVFPGMVEKWIRRLRVDNFHSNFLNFLLLFKFFSSATK